VNFRFCMQSRTEVLPGGKFPHRREYPLCSRVECGFVNLMWDLGSGPHFVMDTALEAGSYVLCGEEDPLAA